MSDWREKGSEPMTRAQQNMLNDCCGCLAAQIKWHGKSLSKDSFRHLLAGTVLGNIMVPGIDRGEGHPGWVMLGRSSRELSKSQASEAIELALMVGDSPKDQGIDAKAVRWSDKVLMGLGFNPDELR